MLLNRNTIFPAAVTAKPIQYALGALRRDFDRIFAATAAPGGRLLLTINHTLAGRRTVHFNSGYRHPAVIGIR